MSLLKLKIDMNILKIRDLYLYCLILVIYD